MSLHHYDTSISMDNLLIPDESLKSLLIYKSMTYYGGFEKINIQEAMIKRNPRWMRDLEGRVVGLKSWDRLGF